MSQANHHQRMANSLSPQQMSQFRDLFNTFDRNHDGAISIDELGSALRDYGIELTETDVHRIVQSVDTNQNGLIEFDEFVGMMQQAISEYNLEMMIRFAFGVFDQNRDGVISLDELRVAYEQVTGQELTTEKALEMVAEADTTGDLMISYQEFRTFVRSLRDEQ